MVSSADRGHTARVPRAVEERERISEFAEVIVILELVGNKDSENNGVN